MQMSCSATWCIVPVMTDKDSKLHLHPNNASILMSDTLKGNVPVLEDEPAPPDPLENQHVVVIAAKRVGSQVDAIVGILRGVLFDVDPEIEFRIQLSEAMDIIEAPGISFDGFELHHGERIINMGGPYLVKAARIDDISSKDQMCTLGLHLKKPAR